MKKKWMKPAVTGYHGGVVFWGMILPAWIVAQIVRILAREG